MNLDYLENDLANKEAAHRALVRKRRDERDERVRAFGKDLDAELAARYDADLLRLAVETQKARESFEAACEAAASDKPWTHPPGTRMVEWECASRFYSEPNARKLTGRVGVTEIITANSEHGKIADYRMAKRGDMVIRILKKDGTPSKVYVGPSNGMLYNWVPEGANIAEAKSLTWKLLKESE
jgi:hypothetical protein